MATAKNKKMNVKARRWILLFILIVVLAFITKVVPNLLVKVKPTEIAQYGEISLSDEVEAYFLREEKVFIAEDNYNIKYTAKEGELVKVGSIVAEITKVELPKKEDKEGNKKEDESPMTNRLGDNAVAFNNGSAQIKGIFSTYIDGYETEFSPDNFKKLKKAKISELDLHTKDVKEDIVKKNFPAFKIVEQSKWNLCFWIENKKVNKYSVGYEVRVKFKDGDTEESVVFTVDKIENLGKESQILLTCNRYYKNFAKMRKAKVVVETLNLRGVIVDNKNIIEKEDKFGVKILSKTGEEVFVEVKVLGTDGKKSALQEGIFYDENGNMVKSIKVFDEVVVEPSKK